MTSALPGSPQLWTDENWDINIPASLPLQRDNSGTSTLLLWGSPEGLSLVTHSGSWLDNVPIFVGILPCFTFFCQCSLHYPNELLALESLSQDLFLGRPAKTQWQVHYGPTTICNTVQMSKFVSSFKQPINMFFPIKLFDNLNIVRWLLFFIMVSLRVLLTQLGKVNYESL